MENLLTENEVAKVLNVSRNFLAQGRMRGCGVPYIKLGKKSVRYSISDVQKYIEANTRGI